MVTKRQIKALKQKLHPDDDQHTEINIYWQQEDGSITKNIDGSGERYTKKEMQQDDQFINVTLDDSYK